MESPRDLPISGLPELSGVGRCIVMGVLNVTSDSFSDGGLYLSPHAAIEHGLALFDAGADVVDVGGESTRPGAVRVSGDDEAARVLPVIAALAQAGVIVSVDTMRADVAERAVAAGARIINDVSGGLADPEMASAVADTGAAYVCSHWRGHGDEMNSREQYDDVVLDVTDALARRLDGLAGAGVAPQQVILDPGLGFAKSTGDLNWPLLARLDALHALGRPVLIGASRKRFLGALLGGAAPSGRDGATVAVTALAAAAGAWGVRVHEPRANADAVRVAAAWTDAADATDATATGAGGAP